MGERPIEVGSPEEAKASGVIFYCLPADLKREMVDPLIWPVVERVNKSGWVWTAESCQGHPDAASIEDTGWLHNNAPYLRLICHFFNEGEMLARLMRAMAVDESREEFSGHNVRLYREPTRGDYAEVMVYVLAQNVMERNAGVAALERFATALDPTTSHEGEDS